MGIFNRFPYTDFHRLNADWILDKLKEMMGITQQAATDAQTAAETVETYETRLASAEDDIDALETRVGTAEDDIDALETRVGAAEDDIDSVETGKADKNRPVVFEKLTLEQQNTQNGVEVQLVGGSPYSAAVHPVTAGAVDSTTYAKLSVGAPTGNNHAANKKYVDDADAAKIDVVTGMAKDLRILKNVSTPGAGGALVASSTTIDGTPYERLEVRSVEGGTIQSGLRRVAAGEPLENTDLATKGYTDTNNGKFVNPVTGSGVALQYDNSQSRLGVKPVVNGSVVQNQYANVAVAEPQHNTDAATKNYVDTQLQEYAEAPAEYVLQYSGGAWSLSDSKTVHEMLTDIMDGKRVVLLIENSGPDAIYFNDFAYYQSQSQVCISAIAFEQNGVTAKTNRYDVVLLSTYDSGTQEFVDTFSVTISDFSVMPTPSANNVGMSYGVIRSGMTYKYGLVNVMLPPAEITLFGSSVVFDASDNEIYTGGTLTSLTLNDYPANGEFTIVFTSGSTPTTTSFPASILGLETFAAEADTIYEINVLNGRAVVGSWAVSV